MSGRIKRIIETAVVLLVTALVFGRACAEQRFQEKMETLWQQYETEESREDNLQLTNLRVNYIADPVGIDTQEITFSWELAYREAPVRQETTEAQGGRMEQAEEGDRTEYTAEDRQSAYRIIVTDDADEMVWDSGIVRSSQTTQVSYAGAALQDLTVYTYTVTSFTEKGCLLGSGRFETACLNTDPFAGAEFITMQETEAVYEDGQPVFCKRFTVKKKPVKAVLLSSALGIYDVYINGSRVGDCEWKPGWTDYNKTLLYQMYDVSDLLQEERENGIAVMLGTGWWCGRNGFGTYDYHRPAFIGKLLLTYEDGSREILTTDETWEYVKDTRVQAADFFNGEKVDYSRPDTAELSLQMQGKAKKAEISHDFRGSFYSSCGIEVAKKDALTQTMQRGWIYETVKENGTTYGEAERIQEWEQEPSEGIFLKSGQTLVVDLGQNLAGVPSVTFCSDTKGELTLTFGEMCNETGSAERGEDGAAGTVYRANYRSAQTQIQIEMQEKQRETYIPTFFYTGFRYLSITTTADVTLSRIQGISVGLDSPEAGSFTCDNEKLQKLYENTRWSQRNNFGWIASDCPQRDERIGWTGDLAVYSMTSMYLQDLYTFYEKWSRDLLDAQREDGAYPDTVPYTITTGSGNAGWADAGIVIPLGVYEKYGDQELLAAAYPSMQAYMEYLEKRSNFAGGQIGAEATFGDWLGTEPSDATFMSALWYGADAFCMERTAAALQKQGDVRKYRKLHEKIRTYLYQTYEIAERLEQMTENGFSQTELCMLLQYDLLMEKNREKAGRLLLSSVEENDYRLMTGFVGTGLILQALTDTGAEQAAYRLLLSEENPSWLCSVEQGATTIWERPDSYTEENGFSGDEMNSFDHYNNGCALQWVYESLLGIRVNQTKEQPITIAPVLPDETIALTQAAGSYHSIYGEIRVSWKMNDRNTRKEGNKSVDIRKKDTSGNGEMVADTEAEFTIEIPAGQTALVTLPIEGFGTKTLQGGIWKFAGFLEQ